MKSHPAQEPPGGASPTAPSSLVLRNQKLDSSLGIILVLAGFVGMGLGLWMILSGSSADISGWISGPIFIIGGLGAFLTALAKAKQGDDRKPKLTLTPAGLEDHRTGFRIEWKQVRGLRMATEVIKKNGQVVDVSDATVFVDSMQNATHEIGVNVFGLDVNHNEVFEAMGRWWRQSRIVADLPGIPRSGDSEVSTQPPTPVLPSRRFRVTTSILGQEGVKFHEVTAGSEEEATAFAILSGLEVVHVEELPVRTGDAMEG